MNFKTFVETPNRVAQVNAALRTRGSKDKLYRGKGYYYFSGPKTSSWPETAVYVSHAEQLSVEEWLKEYDHMKQED